MTDGLINCKMVKDIIEEEISKIMANKGHDDKTLRQEKRIHRKRKSKLGRSKSGSIFSVVVVLMAVGHPGGNVTLTTDGCKWISWENGDWCGKSASYLLRFSPSDAAGSASTPLDMLVPLSEPFLIYPSFHWLPLVFQEFCSNVIFPWKKSSWIAQARFDPSVI